NIPPAPPRSTDLAMGTFPDSGARLDPVSSDIYAMPKPAIPARTPRSAMPDTLTIRPWPDPLIDTLGHDPRSRYVEAFWLPTLGPTALLLLRHLADRFDRSPDGVELSVADPSQALGVGQRDGSSSPLARTLPRLGLFG